MTDEQHALASMTARTTELAREALKHAHLLGPSAVEQAGALLTAATTIIEQHVGAADAPTILLGMIQPTIDDWQAASGAVRH